MISTDEVLLIHRRLIEDFGGSDGVRDEGIMLSAIARPYSGFGDTEFYQTPVEKAAAIIESIVKNHRTGDPAVYRWKQAHRLCTYGDHTPYK